MRSRISSTLSGSRDEQYASGRDLARIKTGHRVQPERGLILDQLSRIGGRGEVLIVGGDWTERRDHARMRARGRGGRRLVVKDEIVAEHETAAGAWRAGHDALENGSSDDPHSNLPIRHCQQAYADGLVVPKC